PLSNVWTDTLGQNQFGGSKSYVVQTALSVVQRCLLMTTSPGDLVHDPTCGSGTTAYVAEQWGRRWITIDTSRVPLALARQRTLRRRGDDSDAGRLRGRRRRGLGGTRGRRLSRPDARDAAAEPVASARRGADDRTAQRQAAGGGADALGGGGARARRRAGRA